MMLALTWSRNQCGRAFNGGKSKKIFDTRSYFPSPIINKRQNGHATCDRVAVSPSPISMSLASWRLHAYRNDPQERAAHAFSEIAKSDKSWQRFRHMVWLALHHQSVDGRTVRSITDVGTDHGLLAVGLAVTGRFDKVLGVDLSPNALKNGGYQVLEKIQQHPEVNPKIPTMQTNGTSLALPINFRLSDGLQNIQPNEADAVCIAGMGVNVMGRILQASTGGGLPELDRIQCQQLILQPTNSRPRNLIQLYDMLHDQGWTLLDERIEYLSKRWYLSCCFVRARDSCLAATDTASRIPTSKLLLLDDNLPMKQVTRNYWQHHLNWIEREELASNGNLHQDDIRWREWVKYYLET